MELSIDEIAEKFHDDRANGQVTTALLLPENKAIIPYGKNTSLPDWVKKVSRMSPPDLDILRPYYSFTINDRHPPADWGITVYIQERDVYRVYSTSQPELIGSAAINEEMPDEYEELIRTLQSRNVLEKP